MRPLTAKESLILSSVALLALADGLEEQGRDSITVSEIRERASSELHYLKGLTNEDLD